MLFRANGRSRIYQRHNKHYASNCILKHGSFGGGNVTVCAVIHHNGRTALVRVCGALNAQIYRDEVPQHHVVPLINATNIWCSYPWFSVSICSSLYKKDGR